MVLMAIRGGQRDQVAADERHPSAVARFLLLLHTVQDSAEYSIEHFPRSAENTNSPKVGTQSVVAPTLPTQQCT